MEKSPDKVLGYGDIYYLFEEKNSLEEAYTALWNLWVKETGQDDQASHLEVQAHFWTVLRDYCDRHNAPWASEGIKKQLQKKGIAVSQEQEFRNYLTNWNKSELLRLLKASLGDYSLMAQQIVSGFYLDSPYTGNFSGYKISVIEKVLKEVLSDLN